jgi:nicotinamide-nucleotide amidase
MSGSAETLSSALPTAVEEAAETLLRACCNMHLKITTAESCTGGLLASLLTDVEGASHAFERGFVVYSEASKRELLGIAADRIEACGAVSRDVAIAMAQGALRQSNADIAFAITGYAGPTDDGGEEGLVHFACARRNGQMAHRVKHFGKIGRGPVRIEALRVALDMIAKAVGV